MSRRGVARALRVYEGSGYTRNDLECGLTHTHAHTDTHSHAHTDTHTHTGADAEAHASSHILIPDADTLLWYSECIAASAAFSPQCVCMRTVLDAAERLVARRARDRVGLGATLRQAVARLTSGKFQRTFVFEDRYHAEIMSLARATLAAITRMCGNVRPRGSALGRDVSALMSPGAALDTSARERPPEPASDDVDDILDALLDDIETDTHDHGNVYGGEPASGLQPLAGPPVSAGSESLEPNKAAAAGRLAAAAIWLARHYACARTDLHEGARTQVLLVLCAESTESDVSPAGAISDVIRTVAPDVWIDADAALQLMADDRERHVVSSDQSRASALAGEADAADDLFDSLIGDVRHPSGTPAKAAVVPRPESPVVVAVCTVRAYIAGFLARVATASEQYVPADARAVSKKATSLLPRSSPGMPVADAVLQQYRALRDERHHWLVDAAVRLARGDDIAKAAAPNPASYEPAGVADDDARVATHPRWVAPRGYCAPADTRKESTAVTEYAESAAELTQWWRQGWKPGDGRVSFSRSRVFRGTLLMAQRSRARALLKPKGREATVLRQLFGVEHITLEGLENLTRALHGDDVLVEVMDRATTGLRGRGDIGVTADNSQPFPMLASEDRADAFASAFQDGTASALAPLLPVPSRTENKVVYGRVVGVFARTAKRIIATVHVAQGDGDDRRVTNLVTPMDVRYPRMSLRSHQASVLAGYRILVTVDDWPAGYKNPRARYVGTIGPVLDLETEVPPSGRWSVAQDRWNNWQKSLDMLPSEEEALRFVALHSVNDVGSTPQPTSFRPLLEIPSPQYTSELHRALDRRDLRWSHPVCSVDPPGCTDIDDALSVRRLPDGRLEVGVHIADVTHFMRQQSALDLEARARGTTVYLVDRRFDMLPRLLSENVCSLRARVDRYAMSTLWTLRPVEGTRGDQLDYVIEPDGCWVGRTIIRSSHALTYDQAKRLLAGKHADEVVHAEGGDRCSRASAPHETMLERWDPAAGSPEAAEVLSRSAGLYPDDPAEGGLCGAPVAVEDEPELRERLDMLRSVAAWLSRRRKAMGAVEFDSSELRFRLPGAAAPVSIGSTAAELDDALAIASVAPAATPTAAEGAFEDAAAAPTPMTEVAAPLELQVKKQEEINNVIAELMIFSNEAVAKLIMARFPCEALLRRHTPADPKRLAVLFGLAESLGIHAPGSGGVDAASVSMQLSSILDGLRQRAAAVDQADVRLALMNALTLRAMNRAEYFATGASESSGELAATTVLQSRTPGGAWLFKLMEVGGPLEFGHFGLGLGLYTHFTSPIRRYADDIVHRQAAAALGLDEFTDHMRSMRETERSTSQHAGPVVHGRGAGIDHMVDLSLGDSVRSHALGEFISLPADTRHDDADDDLFSAVIGDDSVQHEHPTTLVSTSAEAARVTPPFVLHDLEALADHLNDRNWSAKLAGWQCNELFLSLYYRNRVDFLEAVVSSVAEDAVVVYIPLLSMDAEIPVLYQPREADEDAGALGTLVALPAAWVDAATVATRALVTADQSAPRATIAMLERLAPPAREGIIAEGAVRTPIPGARARFANTSEPALQVLSSAGAVMHTFRASDRIIVTVTSEFSMHSSRRQPLRVDFVAETPRVVELLAEATQAPVRPAQPVASSTSPSPPSSSAPVLGGLEPGKPAMSSLYAALELVGASVRALPESAALIRARKDGSRARSAPAVPRARGPAAKFVYQGSRRRFGRFVPSTGTSRAAESSTSIGMHGGRQGPLAAGTSAVELAGALGLMSLDDTGAAAASFSRKSAAEMADSLDDIQSFERDAMSRTYKLRAEHRHARIDKQKRAQK